MTSAAHLYVRKDSIRIAMNKLPGTVEPGEGGGAYKCEWLTLTIRSFQD